MPLHTPTFETERPCSCRDPKCTDIGKHPRIMDWTNQATTDETEIRRWWQMWPEANVGILTGKRAGFFALDVDGAEGRATLTDRMEKYGPLPKGPTQVTGSGGRHLLFAYEPGLKNAVKFAPGLDIRTDGGMIVAEPSVHGTGNEYRWREDAHPADCEITAAPQWIVLEVQAAQADRKTAEIEPGGTISEGSRNATLASHAGTMRRRGMTATEIEAALQVMNRERVVPPLDESEVREIAVKISRYSPATNGVHPSANGTSVVNVVSVVCRSQSEVAPLDLEPEALYGFPGQVVLTIEPHTESSQAAILASFLAGAGILLGRGPHVYRDGSRHAANEFFMLVGPTATGKKGSATRRVDELFLYTDSYDYTNSITRGLGSGEALIEAVACSEEERKFGEPEKRALVFEEEFSKPLKVMRREGSILSETLRAAWDGAVLSNRTKGKRLEARKAHISILGHITEEELQEEMSSVSVFNGFANRFLWIYTERSKSLPFGGGDVPLAPLVKTLHDSLIYASTLERLEFDPSAARLWAEGGLYDLLVNRPPGLLGAVTTRAASHVTRLALQYAVWDLEQEIRVPHLLAALAVWDLSERTCERIFGTSCGDSYADTILEVLTERYPGGMTRTEIRDHFRRNAAAGRIPKALRLLEAAGKAGRVEIATGGRPTEMWQAIVHETYDQYDINDKSPLHRARTLVDDWGLGDG